MSESNNKDVNDLENLNLHDEFDEDDGYDMESLNKEPNGHLEKIFQTTAELQARAKTKKQTDVPKSNQLKTLKPRPDNKEVIIIPSNQIINSNGAQLFYDSVSNTLIQLNTQQPRNIQIQNIKKQLEQTVINQTPSPLNNQQDQYLNYTPSQSPLINENNVSWASPSPSQLSNSFPNTPVVDSIDDFIEGCGISPHELLPYNSINSRIEPSPNNYSEYFHPLQNNNNNNNSLDERDICKAEIKLLPNLDSILKLKKERGET